MTADGIRESAHRKRRMFESEYATTEVIEVIPTDRFTQMCMAAHSDAENNSEIVHNIIFILTPSFDVPPGECFS